VGFKAGVGTASAVVGLAVILGLVYFMLRRRRRQKTDTQVQAPWYPEPKELPDTPPQEMDVEVTLHELYADHRMKEPQELEVREAVNDKTKAEYERTYRGD